ncbi:hypothetical protein LJB77_03205, partial [Ruminococcaceae bacterium OttesenSCG-928-N02]|nr:hypothetical protein [Ruminococcaceae bacterium OttesenSCG-928-N02]
GLQNGAIYQNANPLALFRAGLAELGIDKLPALTFLYPQESVYTSFVSTLNQTWQSEFGAFFNLATLPLNELQQTVAAGDYDIALVPLAAVDESLYNTLNGYFAEIGQSENNITEQGAELLSTLANAQGTAVNPAALKLQKLLVDGGYICPLHFESTVFAAARWVQGLVVSPFGPTLNVGNIYQ